MEIRHVRDDESEFASKQRERVVRSLRLNGQRLSIEAAGFVASQEGVDERTKFLKACSIELSLAAGHAYTLGIDETPKQRRPGCQFMKPNHAVGETRLVARDLDPGGPASLRGQSRARYPQAREWAVARVRDCPGSQCDGESRDLRAPFVDL